MPRSPVVRSAPARFARLALITALVLGAPAAGLAADLHVDGTTGMDGRDGLTWPEAFRTIARAIEVANALPGDDVIHVAAGTYRENLRVDESGTSLLGGYPPGGGARDPATHATIVDGGAVGPGIVVSGADGTVVLQGVAIDGFTITNGRSFRRGGVPFGGAGVFIEEAAVRLTNNVIRNNVADGVGAKGGGVYVFRTAAPATSVTSNRIEDNVVSDGIGGGVSLVDQGDPRVLGPLVLDGNAILRNRAIGATDPDPSVVYDWGGQGGGAWIWGGRPVVEDNDVRGNVAETALDEATFGQGGGLFLLECDPALTNNVIAGNEAVAAGGRFGANGAGAYMISVGGTIAGNEFSANTARGGSGRYQALGGGLNVSLFDATTPRLTNNVVRDNLVVGGGLNSASGGGLYAFVYGGANARMVVEGGVVEGNQAPNAGGGIYAYADDVAALRLDAILVRANEADYASGVMALGDMEITNLRIRENAVHDVDGDLVSEVRDTCPGLSNPVQVDTDSDGAGDDCDTDDDDDGVADATDNCRVVDNPSQADADADGQGDACDGDRDADGWADAIDNCPQVANPMQDDATADGVGDACEPAAFDALETDASGIWVAGDSRVSNVEVSDNVGQGILVVGVPDDPIAGTTLDHASPVITNATITNNAAIGFITYLASGTTWRDTIITGNVWSDGIDTEDLAGDPSSPGMICDHVNFGDGLMNLPCTGPGNFAATARFVSGPLGDYYLSQAPAGQAVTSSSVDAGSRTVTGSVVQGLTTRTDGVADSGTVDLGFHYGAGPPPTPNDPIEDAVRVTSSPTGVSVALQGAPGSVTTVRVYRGDLDVLRTEYSHRSPFSGQAGNPECSWSAATPFVDTAARLDGRDWYYLVVPLSGGTEGSFGTDSDGIERPHPADSPTDMVVNACP